MVSKTLIFNGPQGLHARPAGALVKKKQKNLKARLNLFTMVILLMQKL